ncbi:hypothetical protein [Paenibacillus nuruki]|nr:hypothetical protein [Paenibacillus nuruki]
MAIGNMELSTMKSSSFTKAVITMGASVVVSLSLFTGSLDLPTVLAARR